MSYRYFDLDRPEIQDLMEFALNQRDRRFGREVGQRDLTAAEDVLVQSQYVDLQGTGKERVLTIREEGWRWFDDAVQRGARRAFRTLPWREVLDAAQQRKLR